MGYEVLTAFFLEAGFLGVMLFGRSRVGPGLHFFATLMVAVGTLGSAFWILERQLLDADAGGLRDQRRSGSSCPADWWAAIFNPSFPYRLVHMVLAAYLTTALVVGAVGAWHLLRRRDRSRRRGRCSRWRCGWSSWWRRSRSSPATCTGSTRSSTSRRRSRRWRGTTRRRRGAPLILFGLPDDAAETTRYALEIPRLGSLILTHSLDGEVQGLKAFPADARPPALIIFWTLPRHGRRSGS